MKIIKTAQFEALMEEHPHHGHVSHDMPPSHPSDDMHDQVDDEVVGPHDEDGSDLPVLDNRNDENEKIEGFDEPLDEVSGDHGDHALSLEMQHGVGGMPTEIDIEPEAMPGFEHDMEQGGDGLEDMLGTLDDFMGGEHEMLGGGHDMTGDFGGEEFGDGGHDMAGGVGHGGHDGLSGDFDDFNEMSFDGDLDGGDVNFQDDPEGDFGIEDDDVAGDVDDLHGHHSHM